jgi:para-nitrobenzyl esterase
MTYRPISLVAALMCGATQPATAQVLTESMLPNPQVAVDAGRLEGRGDPTTGVVLFRGIPYAAPPVGGLRWRPRQPA